MLFGVIGVNFIRRTRYPFLKRTYRIQNLEDHFLVYPSEQEVDKVVAHSLRTDQVGVGNNAEEAIYALFRAMINLIDEVEKDPKVEWLQPAPEPVRARFGETMQKVPAELMARIIHRVRSNDSGEWASRMKS